MSTPTGDQPEELPGDQRKDQHPDQELPPPASDAWADPAGAPAAPADPVFPPASGSGGYTTQMEQLTRSSSDLGERVTLLADAVRVVGELQAKQDEFEQTVILEREHQQSRFLKLAGGLLAGMFAVAIILYVILLNNVNDLIDNNNKTAYASCTSRNQAQEENAEREQRLAELEDNKELRDLHASSAKRLRETLSDCSRWQK